MNLTIVDDTESVTLHLNEPDPIGITLVAGVAPSTFLAHVNNTSNPHAVTKAQVGLGNVTNDAQLKAASNLADVASAAAARGNLGLGGAATLNVGTAAGTVAAGNDSRIAGAASQANLDAHTNGTSGVHGVTGSVVGTTDAQTLSGKTFSDGIQIVEIATPANPAATKHKIYAKADGRIYHLNSAGIESEVGAGGGGGGGSLMWIEDVDAAVPDTEFNMRIYRFSQGLSQQLFALVKVPSTYVAGTQIFLKSCFYSGDNANNVRMRARAELYKPGTTTLGSANFYLSTNADAALGAGTVNKLQALSLDLTDASGQIGGSSVAAGDFIQIRLYRTTTTGADSTADAKVPVFGAEVKFA